MSNEPKSVLQTLYRKNHKDNSVSEPRQAKRKRDEMCQCARCGVEFLWSAEEQRHQVENEAPTTCAGCRMLTPTAGRERGVVKWYDPRKKYGFIVRQKETEIFTHRSQVEESGRLHEGDLVEFRAVQGDKGWMASEVRRLEVAVPEDSA